MRTSNNASESEEAGALEDLPLATSTQGRGRGIAADAGGCGTAGCGAANAAGGVEARGCEAAGMWGGGVSRMCGSGLRGMNEGLQAGVSRLNFVVLGSPVQ